MGRKMMIHLSVTGPYFPLLERRLKESRAASCEPFGEPWGSQE
jgi:hypothetical protein